MNKVATITLPPRKTLVQLQGEAKVRDPAAHAKLQISELDKTAAHSKKKRTDCIAQIEKDKHEVEHVEGQIARLRERYDPLCDSLNEKLERKKHMTVVLKECVKDEKQIMGDTKNTVKMRMLDDSKLMRSMASMELETLRGYNMRPESTFHTMRTQSDFALSGGNRTGTQTLPSIPSGKLPRNLSSTL